MKNNIAKYVIVGLASMSIIVAVAASLVLWHQPVTPNCVA